MKSPHSIPPYLPKRAARFCALALVAGALASRAQTPAANAPAAVAPPAVAAVAPPATAAVAPPAVAPAPAAAGPGGAAPESTPAGQLFGARCTSCHTIGDGPRIGPDLLGVAERRKPDWITTFLHGPGKLIDSGDPTAVELFKRFNVRMPDQNLSDGEIAGLISFFQACAVKGSCHPSSVPKLGLDATAEEIEQGRALFTGAQRFSAGGPACAECHGARGAQLVSGGTLGGDLTFAWARLHEAGLSEAIGRAPIEQTVYAGHALTDAEKFALRGYFADLARNGARPQRRDDFFQLGLLLAAASLGAIGIAWATLTKGGAR